MMVILISIDYLNCLACYFLNINHKNTAQTGNANIMPKIKADTRQAKKPIIAN